LSGLSCARTLRSAGQFVDLFEQSSGVGGRIATLRVGGQLYDHGAQYVTARDSAFKAYLDELLATGYVKRWDPRIAAAGDEDPVSPFAWYVGMPGMSSMVRPLAEGVQCHFNRTVHTIARSPAGWRVWFDDETSAGPYAAVAVCVPAPAARLLLGPVEDMAGAVSRATFSPCWAILIRLDPPIMPRFDVYSDMSQKIRWITRNNSKPGRAPGGENIVIHASQDFSRDTEDEDPAAVADEIWADLCHLLDLPPTRPLQTAAFLWRHGLVDRPLGDSFLYESEHRVGVAGDWCMGRLAEHAFVSGHRLGRTIVAGLS